MIKLISLVVTLAIAMNGLAAYEPNTIKGQGDSSASQMVKIEIPNKLATQTGNKTYLIESGNKNILTNPSFEAVVNGPMTGWAQTGIVSANVETTVVFDGKSSVDLSSPNQALDFHQDSTLYQAQFADGPQGLAMMRVKTTCTDAPIYLCPRTAGAYPSQKTSGCVQVQPTGKWKLYKIPFLLGGTSNGIGITSNGSAITCDTYIDDAFVGAVDLKTDVDQSRMAGESYFAGTASCNWTRASTSIGAFSAVAACPGPTVAYSSMGAWQTTDSDLPRQTITNLPAGVYKATFIYNANMSTGAASSMAISDGVTTCYPSPSEDSATASSGQIVSCTFKYSSAGDRSFELYGASAANTLNLTNSSTTPPKGIKFQLEYFGSGSVYSTTNADADWADCNFSTLAWQGLGTVTPSVQCKRDGGDLLLKGKFIVGTTSASNAQIPLPLWNGVQLTSKGTSVIPSIQAAGQLGRNVANANYWNALISPSVTYIEMGLTNATSANLTALGGSTIVNAGETIYLNQVRIPIATWDNSNIIIGQFNGLESCTDSFQCETEYTAKISNACAITDQTPSTWLSSCTLSGTSDCICTHVTGKFTSTPNYTASSQSTTTEVDRHISIYNASASGFSSKARNGANADTASPYTIKAFKTGSDYVTKTARAVSSDQNIATPGVTKAVLYSARVSSAGVVSQETGDWINGSCVNSGTSSQASTCTLVSSKFASIPNCQCTATNPGALGATTLNCVIDETATSASSIVVNTSANSAASARGYSIICHGQAP